MRNQGLFSTLFIEDLKAGVSVDNAARGRLAVLGQTWGGCERSNREALWESFIKKALEFLEFVPAAAPCAPGLYPLYEDWGFANCIAVLCLAEPGADLDDDRIGQFLPGRLVGELKKRKLNWGILTDGATWRLYSLKTSKPYEDFVELDLAGDAIEGNDEGEYGLFERFFHKDAFEAKAEAFSRRGAEAQGGEREESGDEAARKEGVYRCRLDDDMKASEDTLEERVKKPLLQQVDEVLQYVCNGFIFDTKKTGEDYTEEERRDIFESAVKLVYRCLFLFYAEARKLLPSEDGKAAEYEEHSIQALCREARKFRWGKRKDNDGYDLWAHMKGLVQSVNEGDPQYGVMGYNGGLFRDDDETFLRDHRLRNDFFARALYLLAYVEPYSGDPDGEYAIPYDDLEVRHLGELYENILEFNVMLADADRIRRRTKKGTEILLASETDQQKGDALIRKGQVYFGESALERKQSGSYYTPESLVRFLNYKAIVIPLREKFKAEYQKRLDEFLKQVESGYDAAARRGAVRSAVALIERFVNDVVLEFRVCDPAMGSGHFLVNAANQMADLIVDLLSQIPGVAKEEGRGRQAEALSRRGAEARRGEEDGEIESGGVTLSPNRWRRLVTRHCLYGVDLNPLAVHLAKLSLWLNSFARDHKLTFLDHHLQSGNSLIGIRTLDQLKSLPKRKNEKKRKKHDEFPQFTDLAMAFDEAASRIAAIAQVDEDDTDRMRSLFEEAQGDAQATLAPLADLYTAYLMDGNIDEDSYRQIYGHLAKSGSIAGIGNVDLLETWESVEGYRDWHRFFHWALAFPSALGGECPGFDATVGNPPWEVVSPNSAEFFLAYDPDFRTYNKQTAEKVMERLKCQSSDIGEKWERYWTGVEEERSYYRCVDAYSMQGKGDFNTFKLFLEQMHDVLRDGGRCGIIIPSGIYTDLGSSQLRRMLFELCTVDTLFGLSNEKFIFENVHHAFKFCVLAFGKGGSTNRFCSGFRIDPREAVRPNALEGFLHSPAEHLTMESALVAKFSPNSLSVPEFSSDDGIVLASKVYGENPTLQRVLHDAWQTHFQREFHMSGDSRLFIRGEQRPGDDCLPLVEGKQLWLLSNRYCGPVNWMKAADAAKKPTTSTIRVAYRALAAATNERTFIAAILPAGLPTGHTVNVCPIPAKHAVTMATVFISLVWDWLVRTKVTTSIGINILNQLPFPLAIADMKRQGPVAAALLARGSRLVCVSEEFAELWAKSFDPEWLRPEFWYPDAGGSLAYGKAHEHEIRERLRNQAETLTSAWGRECGVYDRLEDHRDSGDRAQLRAEIDAYVAHLYGLSRDDFAYILDTFPVLKKKEKKAFGEFQSKRKCLEEFDRLAPIVKAEG